MAEEGKEARRQARNRCKRGRWEGGEENNLCDTEGETEQVLLIIINTHRLLGSPDCEEINFLTFI